MSKNMKNDKNGSQPHPFDEVAKLQSKWRTEARQYYSLIKSGCLFREEKRKLFFWFMQNGEIKDPKGKIRLMLINNVTDEDIVGTMDKWMPEHLREKLEKRLLAAPSDQHGEIEWIDGEDDDDE